MWYDIYEALATTKPSDKPPPRLVCDEEEEFSEPESYHDENLNI